MKGMPNLLKYYINLGENETTKLIHVKHQLPESIFETTCAMLNKNGGHIFLGVTNNSKVVGVYKNYISDIKRNFYNICNNYFTPSINIMIYEYTINDKVILYINIKSNFNIYRYKNKVYYRCNNFDLDITNNEKYLSNIFLCKNSYFINNKYL